MKRGIWAAAFVGTAILALLAAWLLGWERGRGDAPHGADRSEGATDAGPARAGVRQGARRGLGDRDHDPSNDLRVMGEIVDPEGNPLVDAVVSLWCLGADGSLAALGGSIGVDASGHFEGPACRDRVCVELHHASAIPAAPWLLEPDRPTTLVARRLARIHGRLEDERGEPLPAVRVAVRPPPDEDDPYALLPVTSATSTTDDHGEFSFALIERPPCGPCEDARGVCEGSELDFLSRVMVVAAPAGRRAVEREVDLDRGGGSSEDPVVLRSSAEGAEISGTLHDPEGLAYPGAYVLARSRDRAYEVRRVEIVDGRFVVGPLGEGPYHVRALQDGIRLAEAEALPGESLTWTGDRSARLRSVILEVQGSRGPVADVQILGGGPFSGASTGRDGRTAVVSALPGAYSLRVRVPGQPSAQTHPVRIDSASGQGEPAIVVIRVAGGSAPDG